MNALCTFLKSAAITAGAICGYYMGPLDGLLTALLIFVIIDYVTGVLAAWVTKSLDSNIGFHGILRKVIIFLVVGVSNVLDVYVIKTGTAIRSGVICFYLANEGLSILENAGRAGLPLPDALKAALEQLKTHKEEHL